MSSPRHLERRRWRHRWRHSLRARLITVFVLLALAMAAVFIVGVRSTFSEGWREAGRPLIADYIDRLTTELGSPPDVARAQALVARLPISIRIEGPTVNWDSDPGRTAARAKRNAHSGGTPGTGELFTRTTADGHRVIFGPALPDWQRGPHGIGWITLALLLALIVAAYVYVRRLLRPLDDIRAGAERFGRGAFDAPIPLRRRDELGDLAQRINTMAHDIQGMLDAKRGLLLALSHELRSPLTRARLNVELLPATPEGEPERAALLRDLNQMRDLISDLLESERLASPHAALQREPVDLAALVREVAAEVAGAAADAKGVLDRGGTSDMGGARDDGGARDMRVTLDLAPDLPPLALDRTRIRLLLRNLLDNALRYSAEAAQPPHLALRRAGAGVELKVRDYGPGVEAAQLERLTEPFYRTDGARVRATGGVGLGLYLCRLVAQAHGGSLSVRNAAPGLQINVLLNP